jgi:hypothetical protein
MRLALLTILVFSVPAFAATGDGSIGEANLSSVVDNNWGRKKDSFVRDNTSHEEIRELVDNLLGSPSKSKNGEKSFPQADSSQ